jgi:hypothetical protein
MAELYRHFDAQGALLYVGISASAVRRLAEHKKGAAWFSSIAFVEVERFPTRAAAQQAEFEAITRERPKYNVTHSVVHALPPPEPTPRASTEMRRKMARYPTLRPEEAAQYLGLELDILRFAVKSDIGPRGFALPPGTRCRDFRSWRTNAKSLEEWEHTGGVVSARVLYRRESYPLRRRRRLPRTVTAEAAPTPPKLRDMDIRWIFDKLNDDALIDDAQLAIMGDLAPSTIKRWRGEGKTPPTVTVNGRTRYRVGDARPWLRALSIPLRNKKQSRTTLQPDP